MNANDWKNRLLAIHRARDAGDELPFDALCGQLADMSAMLAAPAEPLPVMIQAPMPEADRAENPVFIEATSEIPPEKAAE